jgi:LPS export ABC transporter protein LptC
MTDRKHSITLHFIKAAVVATGCFFVLGCENDPKMIEDWSKNKVMVEEGKDIVSYLSQTGVMKAKLTAPLMYRYESDTVYAEFPHSLHVDFYNDSTQIESWLDAKYGKYFENLNKVYLRDSVVAINIKGDTLKCPELWWDQNQQKFYTDKYAQLHTKDKHIYGGKGLEASQDFRDVIFKEPTGTVLVSDSGIPQ